MRKILSTTLFLLAVVAPVVGQERPTSFIQKRVTFSIPTHWVIQKQEDSKTMGRTQIFIPYPITDDTPHSANAAIIANTVPSRVTIKEVGDRIYQLQHPGLVVVNDIADGEYWRTIVWTARTEGAPYLMLDRFGVVNGVAVEFMVGFPLLENGDQKWIERVVEDFNVTCLSLKVDGTNSDKAKVYLDKLPSSAGSPQQSGDQKEEKIYEPKEVDQKARIISKPEPQYTEQARRHQTSDWVALRVVLKSSGEIGDIKVIKDAPDGLTEECIKAAKEIKFEPAIKDGHPVSMYIRVEYRFN